MKLIFASKSPRREKMLSRFDLDVVFRSHCFDEKSVDRNIDPSKYCALIAEGKSSSLLTDINPYPILSADTIVTVEGEILGKPSDFNDAFNMLTMLSGKTHSVLTAVNILYPNNNINLTFTERTYVTFNEISSSLISYYIEKYQPFDKSGSYGIQGFSSIFVNKINGCYFNVVGLPLSSLFYKLKKLNLIDFPLKTLNKNNNLLS
tara:strand:- start:1405 stop:2019 length:615 start_codon:yes stop_codon:yes gene_type:complete